MKNYKVSQEFMEMLNKWKEEYKDKDGIVDMSNFALERLPTIVDEWRFDGVDRRDKNERLGAIINWINGEDVFEVGKTHKFGVRSVNNYYGGRLWLRVRLFEDGVGLPSYNNLLLDATLFTKRDEAELWTTNGFEVVEVDENEL